jgi:uncharacterized membrane protein YgaE (UPF0421/DUF939 family)
MKELEKSIKTGISVGITIFLGRLLKIDSLFYAGIAAVICSQVDNIESIKTGRGRIYGTFIGASVGLLCYKYLPANPLILALGTCFIVYITKKYLKMSQSNIACIVFLGIMVNLQAGKTPDSYVVNRMIDTSLGVLVSIAVSHISFFKLNKNKKEG